MIDGVGEDVDVVFAMLDVVMAVRAFLPLLATGTSIHGLSSSLELSICASVSACGKGLEVGEISRVPRHIGRLAQAALVVFVEDKLLC